MNAGFEVGSAVSLRAFHCMPVEGPEGELHSHDYRIKVVGSRRQLDARGMVCDLDVLNERCTTPPSAWKERTWRRSDRHGRTRSPSRSSLGGCTIPWQRRSAIQARSSFP